MGEWPACTPALKVGRMEEAGVPRAKGAVSLPADCRCGVSPGIVGCRSPAHQALGWRTATACTTIAATGLVLATVHRGTA